MPDNGKVEKAENGNSIRFSLPAWLVEIGKQSPIAMVLLLMLWWARSDSIDALSKFTNYGVEQRKEFLDHSKVERVEMLASLHKLEALSKERTDLFIRARETEVERMIKSFDKLSEALAPLKRVRTDGNGVSKPADIPLPDGSIIRKGW